MCGVLEPAVTPSVARNIGRRFIPHWLRRGSPQIPRRLVLQIEGLAGTVGHGVVAPRRQLMFAAVHGPGVATALRRHLKAEAGIGDHVDPWCGRRLARSKGRHIFPAALGEAAKSVEEFDTGRRSRHLKLGGGDRTPWRDTWRKPGIGNSLELIDQPPAVANQHDTRDGPKKGSGLGWNQVGPEHEGVPGWPLVADLWPRLAGPYQGLERDLQLLHVGRSALVEDHQIHCKLLHPPILHSLKRLLHDAQLMDVIDADQDDRKVAGNAQGPQTRLTATPGADGLGWRTQHRRSVDHVSGKTLVLARLGSIDAEVVQLHLGLGPGQHGGALKRAHVMVLVDQIQRRLAGRGDHRPEINAGSRPRRNPHTPAQGEDRVEHRAGGARKRPAAHDRAWRANTAATTEESRSVGLELALTHSLAIDNRQVRRPDLWLGRRPLPPSSENGAKSGEVLGLDEQLREGGVRHVRGLRRQDQFGIRRHFDFTEAIAEVRDRHSAHFRVVFRGDEHLEICRECAVPTGKFGAILVERDLVGLRLSPDRLVGRRPDVSVGDVLQKDVRAPVVAGGVLSPAGHRQVPPGAVARPRGRQHDRVASV